MNEKAPQTMEQNHFHKLTIQGVKVEMPYRPYPSQLEIMSKIIKCCKNNTNGTFESPTGTGKTISILASSLSWQKSSEARSRSGSNQMNLNQTQSKCRIFITSRVQKQLKQTVTELRDKTNLKPRMAMIGSRKHMCIHAEKESWYSIDEECLKMRQPPPPEYLQNRGDAERHQKCPHYNLDREGRLSNQWDEFKTKIWDIEDLVTKGVEMGSCPYYASRSLAKEADVVFGPYNYFIDPSIRSRMNVNMTGSVLIIDEAHNVEDTATECLSMDVQDAQLQTALEDFDKYEKSNDTKIYALTVMVSRLKDILKEHKEQMTNQVAFTKAFRGPLIWKPFESVSLSPDMIENASNQLRVIVDIPPSDKQKIPFYKLLRPRTETFLLKLFAIFDNINRNEFSKEFTLLLTFDGYQAKMSFLCLSARVVFEQLGSICKSVILASGTLSPLSTFQKELGIPFAESAECNHVIQPHQIFARAVPTCPQGILLHGVYSNRSTTEYMDAIGSSILRLVSQIPNGVLAFLPSYTRLDELIKHWKSSNIWTDLLNTKEIFMEPRGTADKHELDRILTRYNLASKTRKGGLLLCVYRGKMSEGIDFANERARGVICVSLPAPSITDPKLLEKKKYHWTYHRQLGISSDQEWYNALTFRALNQALGRCIRHRNDWGGVFLLDSRIQNQIELLPKWFQKYIHSDENFADLEEGVGSFVRNAEEWESTLALPTPTLIEPPNELCCICKKNDPISIRCQASHPVCVQCWIDYFEEETDTVAMIFDELVGDLDCPDLDCPHRFSFPLLDQIHKTFIVTTEDEYFDDEWGDLLDPILLDNLDLVSSNQNRQNSLADNQLEQNRAIGKDEYLDMDDDLEQMMDDEMMTEMTQQMMGVDVVREMFGNPMDGLDPWDCLSEQEYMMDIDKDSIKDESFEDISWI